MAEWDEEKEAFIDWPGIERTPARAAEMRREREFRYEMGRLGYPSRTPGAEPSPAGKAAQQLLHDYFTNAGLAPDYLAKASAGDVATITGKATTGAARISGKALVGAYTGAARERAGGFVRGAEIAADQEQSEMDQYLSKKNAERGRDFGSVYADDIAVPGTRVVTERPWESRRRKKRPLSTGYW